MVKEHKMLQRFFHGKGQICAIILLIVLPIVLPRFYVYFASLILIYGLLATSNNFALGYGGIYQMHHGVFYGIGAYGAALIITKAGLSPWIGFLVGPLVSALLSLIMGIICIRLSKLYFGMLQISLGSLVWAVAYRWYGLTGGDDGIHGIPVPNIVSSYYNAYYFTLIIVGFTFFVIYKMIKSPFGNTMQAIRDNTVRCAMLGVNVHRHQLAALVFAGFRSPFCCRG